MSWCQWGAVAPEGATFEDLCHPAAWRRVQQNKRPAIRQDDEIRITAFDRSWRVWVVVDHATVNGLVISSFSDAKGQAPREHLAEDDLYIVRHNGIGFAVYRKSDDQKVTDTWDSAARAATGLNELYPKIVS